MAAKDEVQLPRLFSRLQRAVDDEDDEKALKLSQQILDTSRDDPDALHCKLVSLIHLSKFDSTLELIRNQNKKKKGSGGGTRQYPFEEAYCLYRKEKYKESLSILSSLPESEQRVMELKAQIAYRQEQYVKAMQAYQHLLHEDQTNEERFANYYATISLSASTGEPSSGGDLSEPHKDSMEQCFNLACCCLARGNGKEAMELLERAESLHQQRLEEEGLSEEEVAEEMAIIQVQKGYSYQIQENQKQAMSSYNSLLKLRPDDPALIAIASNNILVLNRDKDVFDSKKKVKVLASEGTGKKLTQSQKEQILFNRCLFALQTNQLELCRELAAQLKASAHADSDLPTLAQVALLNRERKTSTALECLENHVKSHTGAGVEVYALLAQLHLNHGDTSQVCHTLHSIPTFPRYVGVATTLATLHAGAGEIDKAMNVLAQTLNHWMDSSQASKQTRTNLVIQVAEYQLAHARPELAVGVLEKVMKEEQDNLKLKALLVSAYSHYDPQKAEEISSHLLRPFQTSTSLTDIDTMEQMPIFRHSRKPAQKSEVAGKTDDVIIKSKKKKRKPRLPKNYDPSVTPDPERWLPLRERSYYRKSRRKGMAPTARGTQGTNIASTNLMSQLDASKPVTKTSIDSGTDGGGEKPVASPKAKPHPQTNKKKSKKKKGGKW